MDRAYRVSVRAALAMSAVLMVVTTATAVGLGIPQLLVWNVPAAAIGLYSRQRLISS